MPRPPISPPEVTMPMNHVSTTTFPLVDTEGGQVLHDKSEDLGNKGDAETRTNP